MPRAKSSMELEWKIVFNFILEIFHSIPFWHLPYSIPKFPFHSNTYHAQITDTVYGINITSYKTNHYKRLLRYIVNPDKVCLREDSRAQLHQYNNDKPQYANMKGTRFIDR